MQSVKCKIQNAGGFAKAIPALARQPSVTGCEKCKSQIGMVDVSEKKLVRRTATAQGGIFLKKTTIEKIKMRQIKKGDPLAVAEIAAINAVKDTPRLIPLCHQIPISKVETSFEVRASTITARTTVTAVAKTGVEMEALAGVSASLLTIWDMVKYLEKDENGQYPNTMITDVRVVEKVKGD